MIYRELRCGEPPDIDTARKFLQRLFFDEKRYDLGTVGRYRINSKLQLDVPLETTVLTEEDMVAILKYVLKLRIGKQAPDDIDHLGNRRVRTVGEQLANQFIGGAVAHGADDQGAHEPARQRRADAAGSD